MCMYKMLAGQQWAPASPLRGQVHRQHSCCQTDTAVAACCSAAHLPVGIVPWLEHNLPYTQNAINRTESEPDLVQDLACLDQVSHFLATLQDLVAYAAAHALLLGKVLDVRMMEGVLNLLDGSLQGNRRVTSSR